MITHQSGILRCITLRKMSALALLVCLAVLAAAYYLQYQYMLAACTLCILQRIIFGAIGVTCVLGIVSKKLPVILRYIYSSLILCFSLIGAALATRQVWLQYFVPPDKTTSCAASLERLIDLYPIFEALKIALSGSADCAVIDFTFFGLSIAVWCLIIFAVFVISSIFAIVQIKKGRL